MSSEGGGGSFGSRAIRLAALCGLAAASSACGPYLRNVQTGQELFQSTAECAQGPFAIPLKASGARWGEEFRVSIESQHAIQGRYRLSVDGKVAQTGAFHSQFSMTESDGYGHPVERTVDDPRPDNARCIARPPPDSPIAAAPMPPAEAEPGPPWVAEPMAPEPPEPARAPAALVELSAAAPRLQAPHWTEMVDFSRTNRDPDEVHGPFAPGAEVEVQFWFDEPNDLDGARVVVTHEDIVPTDEAAWIAKLHQARLDRQREEAEGLEKERKRDRWCQAHHDDEDCWGPGGYDGAVKRDEQARAEALARASAPTPPPQPAPAPPRQHVDEMPPPARVESPPPRPSPHAEWVSGYWHRADDAWIWLEGWWKVPESDLRANLTATAPSAPPVAQAEVRPVAVRGAIWIPGSWFWSGQAWVWYAGHWSLPPAAGAIWVAPRWIRFSDGVRLDPGRWRVPGR